jgi:hypothetical protein
MAAREHMLGLVQCQKQDWRSRALEMHIEDLSKVILKAGEESFLFDSNGKLDDELLRTLLSYYKKKRSQIIQIAALAQCNVDVENFLLLLDKELDRLTAIRSVCESEQKAISQIKKDNLRLAESFKADTDENNRQTKNKLAMFKVKHLMMFLLSKSTLFVGMALTASAAVPLSYLVALFTFEMAMLHHALAFALFVILVPGTIMGMASFTISSTAKMDKLRYRYAADHDDARKMIEYNKSSKPRLENCAQTERVINAARREMKCLITELDAEANPVAFNSQAKRSKQAGTLPALSMLAKGKYVICMEGKGQKLGSRPERSPCPTI